MDFSEVIHHFDGGDCAFITFIAKDATAAIFCLIHVVTGEQSIDDGDVALEI